MSRRRCSRKSCTLTVFQSIKRSGSIREVDGFSKRQIQNVLNELRIMGIIHKVGYGTWETLVPEMPSDFSKRKKVKLKHRVAKRHIPSQGALPDTVRGHGIVVTLKVPPLLQGWGSRAQILTRSGIPFSNIPQGQRVSIGDIKKVWLTDRSIVYYLTPYNWYGDTAPEVAWEIIKDVIDLAKKTERSLGIKTLKINGRYQIKISRQHYALIKNGLAEQYHKDRKRLFVYDEKGLWLLIDNSKPDGTGLHETETVHPETAVSDNKTVQRFFNDLKANPVTPGEILNIMNRLANEQQHYREDLIDYGKNIAAHGRSMDTLAEGIKDLTKLVKVALGRRRQSGMKEYI